MIQRLLSSVLTLALLSNSTLHSISNMQLKDYTSTWSEDIAIDKEDESKVYRSRDFAGLWREYYTNAPTFLEGNQEEYDFYKRYSNGKDSILIRYDELYGQDNYTVESNYLIPRNATLEERFLTYFGINEINPEAMGIYYINLATGEEYSFHGEELFIAASTWKLGLGMAIEDQIKAEKLSKNTGIYYTPEFDVGGTQFITGYYDHYTYIPVSTLMYKMLVPSGNVSAALLWTKLNQLTKNNLQTYLDLVDAGEMEYNREENAITPKFQAYLMRKIYEQQDSYKYVIELLDQAYTKDYARKYIRNQNGVHLIHKCGFYEGHINDVILNLGEYPFVLAIYTNHIDSPKEHIANLAGITTMYTRFVNAEIAQAEIEGEQIVP